MISSVVLVAFSLKRILVLFSWLLAILHCDLVRSTYMTVHALFLLIGVSTPLGGMPSSRMLTSVATVNMAGGIPLQQAGGGVASVTQSSLVPRLPISSLANQNATGTGQNDNGGSLSVILSSSSQPIPARLARRIVAGEFIEMRELLCDNIALHDQLESIHGSLQTVATPGALRARMREVPSLSSWVYCFAAYVAVRSTDPLVRDMLAYMRLVVRESLRHGGGGWQEYDRNFRRLAAIDPSLRWNSLLPDLQASTILGQRGGGGVFCSLCRGVDHTSAQCALTYMQQPVIGAPGQDASNRPQEGRWRSQRPLARVCTSWNRGSCAYPGSCTFRHVCISCRLPHRAKDCPDTPADSPWKRFPRAAPNAPSSSSSGNSSRGQ